MKFNQLTIFFLFLSLQLNAQQEFETIVTETKFNSSSRVVIDKEEIEKSHAKSLTSLLASQANISIAQSNFTPTTIFLRGGDSSHVLILVDGVSFYDASSVQRTINLNSIDVKSVQRIEVIKGSQSVLYGGQALSGVIKIETIPKELKNSGQMLQSTGSFNQYLSQLGVNRVVQDQSAVFVRGSYSYKEAASPVLDSKKIYPTRLGTGELAYVNRNSALNYLLKTQTSFDKTEIALAPAYRAVDTNNFETSTYQVNTTGVFTLPTAAFMPSLSVSSQQSARAYEQDYISSGGSPTKRDYIGNLLAIRYEMTPLDLGSSLNLKVGGSFNLDKMIYREADVLMVDVQSEFEGFFIKSLSEFNQFVSLELGARVDYNKMKNEISTYQAGLTLFQDLKLEYSTGFKQPSLFQLYSDYGNLNLEPEKSKSIALSYDKKISDYFNFSYTYFETQFENLIITRGSPIPKYENVQTSTTKGHELSLTYRDREQGFNTNLTLGYQEPYDRSQDSWLVRRPLRTASFKIRKELEALGIGLEVLHNGNRRDRTSSTSYGTLSAYTVTNLIADYKSSENLTLFTRIQNLADSHYESSYGFYDEGLNAQVGAEVNF